MSWRRDLPNELANWGRVANIPTSDSHVRPIAHDNTAEVKTLLYGPKGETLIRQEPRPVGFRKP